MFGFVVFVPGMNEVLRVQGKAMLLQDRDWQLASKSRQALKVRRLQVQSVLCHFD